MNPEWPTRAFFRRTYLEDEWADETKRHEYIQEARQVARDHAPAEVSIYVTPRHGRKGLRVVQIVAH